jgi:hypothetical protein
MIACSIRYPSICLGMCSTAFPILHCIPINEIMSLIYSVTYTSIEENQKEIKTEENKIRGC